MSKEQRTFPGNEARALIERGRTAALATLSADDGMPYVSLVTVATDESGAPIILISDLAVHTKNLKSDGRASLLFEETAGLAEPLTGARVTAMGQFERVDDEAASAAFLKQHPDASFYADFSDFAFWRMNVDKVHAIAGFGRIVTLRASEVFGGAE